MEFDGFQRLVEQISASKKVSIDQINEKLCSTSGPSTAGTTGVANKDNVDRMTDTSKYTGGNMIFLSIWQVLKIPNFMCLSLNFDLIEYIVSFFLEVAFS
jgi:hypothetical protein